MDIDPKHEPDVVGDNRAMPFKADDFDVVVYDPPHVPNQGKDRAKDFNARFGLAKKSPAENGYNFTHLYPPFMAEAYRVLQPEGVSSARSPTTSTATASSGRTSSQCRRGRSRFSRLRLHCQGRKGPIVDPKWKTAHHARRQHCYWLVFRKSKKCE